MQVDYTNTAPRGPALLFSPSKGAHQQHRPSLPLPSTPVRHHIRAANGGNTPTSLVTSPHGGSTRFGLGASPSSLSHSFSTFGGSGADCFAAATATGGAHLRTGSGVGLGDRYITDRDEASTRMAHYLLTSPHSDHLPAHLRGGGGTAGAAGPSGGALSAAASVNSSIIDASAPAFAGSPNASPNRGRGNQQNRAPDGGAGRSGAEGGGPPPQPYARSLAKALFAAEDDIGGDAASAGVSVLGFKTTNRPATSSSFRVSAGPSMPRLSSPLFGGPCRASFGAPASPLPEGAGRTSTGTPSASGSSPAPAVTATTATTAAGRSSGVIAGAGSLFTSGGVVSGSSSSSQSALFRASRGVVYQENRARGFQSHTFRVIPQTPERILDAPELLDDFYLNLLDWSAGNTLAVALGPTAYLWNAADGSIAQLMASEQRENIITALAWAGKDVSIGSTSSAGGGASAADGGSAGGGASAPLANTIAVGLNEGVVELWDAETQQKVRSIAGHGARVCSLSWSGGLLASGSRDTAIHLHDARDPSIAGAVRGHTQEVCGLRWSPNHSGTVGGGAGVQLASGGNDNLLNIWDLRRASMEVAPLWQLRDHTAAVKALAWNPRQPSLLVSGGGTADKCLRFWDTLRGECVNMIDTQSQVCGVLWSRDGTELVSSHGYSDNQLTLWRYPSCRRLADLTGHTSRVLHLAMSPDGQTVVSAAGDETIRFWRCFAPDAAAEAAAAAASNPFLASPLPAFAGGYGSPKKRPRSAAAEGANGGGSSSPFFCDFGDFGSGTLR